MAANNLKKKNNQAETDDAEAQFLAHVQQIMIYHQGLLRDEARNKFFYKAIKQSINDRTRVLDIGAGSGVWAITAAKLGAKKVTAIESDAALIPVIAAHARENGVADKVEIIHGNSLEVDLQQKYDLIISETIGNQAFDENITETMIDAKKRFLARNGKLIPQKIALVAAPSHLENETETPLGVPIRTDYIKDLAFNLTSKVVDKNQLKLLARPVTLLEIDLRNLRKEPSFKNMNGRWKLGDVSEANTISLWAVCELTDGVVLDTWKTSSWSPVICRLKPIEVKKGSLEFSLNIHDRIYHWRVGSPSKQNTTFQSYAPLFAYTKIKLAASSFK